MNICLGFDDLNRNILYLVELHDVGMPKYLQNTDLSGDSFDIGLLDNFLLLKSLDRDLHVSRSMDSEPYFSKGAFSYGLP